MAESCIVCLGDLYQDDPGASTTAEVASKSPLENNEEDAANPTSTPPLQLPEGEPELIAHLLPCGHFLHDECLKPWVERANSCPVCRQTFNMVEVSASLRGKHSPSLCCIRATTNLLLQRSRRFLVCSPRQTTSCRYRPCYDC